MRWALLFQNIAISSNESSSDRNEVDLRITLPDQNVVTLNISKKYRTPKVYEVSNSFGVCSSIQMQIQ